MPNPRLATRYAKSLIDLAIEKNQLEEVYADMQWLSGVSKSNRDFVNLLRSPVVKGETKQKVLAAVTEGKISAMTAGFNRLLVAKGRESNLPEISEAFIKSYKVKKEIQTVRLITATTISESLKNEIIDQVKKSGDFKHVELEEKIDESLIGGFVLQVGDKLIDASVLYDLKNISKQFENNDFIYNIR
jgi:F-type H+-transporting ATPase subunit delta